MGYDMYAEDGSGDINSNELGTPEKAREALRRQAERGGYFRFSVWGMAAMRRVMDAAEVLSDEDPPTWPTWPGEDASSEEQATADGEAEKVRRTRSPIEGRVPHYKFCSNDHWLVCPEECIAIAQALELWLASPENEDPTYLKNLGLDAPQDVKDFAAFNRLCSTRGGYRVD